MSRSGFSNRSNDSNGLGISGEQGEGAVRNWAKGCGEIRNPGADWSFTMFTTLMRDSYIRLIYSRIANRIHARHAQTRQSPVDI
jgi:hypothetical protein